MLVIAAFLEAFWSSMRSIPFSLKYAVGAGLWLLVAMYLYYGGRQYAPTHQPNQPATETLHRAA